MKNEMPTTILVRETLNLVMLPEIGEEILTTEQREEYQDYTRTDLTDRRTDVDALIKVAVEVAESLTQLTGMNVDDLYEAVDAVTEKRNAQEIVNLKAQLKRERELTDEALEAFRKYDELQSGPRQGNYVDFIADLESAWEGLEKAIAAIHSEREGSK